MVDPFKPTNRFSDVVSIAAAAVEWQGVPPSQQEFVVVDDGIPFLAGAPDLTLRAQAIKEAAGRRAIKGYTHNEDGADVPAKHVWLYRESVDAWIAKARKRLPPDMPMVAPAAVQEDMLLRAEAVYVRLGISKSTFHRWVRDGKIEPAHAENPSRWRSSYVASLVASPKGDSDDSCA